MGNLFKSSDIVKSAIEIEKNGKDFYNAASKAAKNMNVKQLLEMLENEEFNHISVFQKILEGLDKNEPAERYPGEHADYMLALRENSVFTKSCQGGEYAKKIRNDLDALKMAIGFEKDSILFYYAMKKYVWEGFHKDIDKIIEQEQIHLKKLSELTKK